MWQILRIDEKLRSLLVKITIYIPITETIYVCSIIMLLLGRVALVAQWPIVVKLSRGRSVGLSVSTCVDRSVCLVRCGKTADRIRIWGLYGVRVR